MQEKIKIENGIKHQSSSGQHEHLVMPQTPPNKKALLNEQGFGFRQAAASYFSFSSLSRAISIAWVRSLIAGEFLFTYTSRAEIVFSGRRIETGTRMSLDIFTLVRIFKFGFINLVEKSYKRYVGLGIPSKIIFDIIEPLAGLIHIFWNGKGEFANLVCKYRKFLSFKSVCHDKLLRLKNVGCEEIVDVKFTSFVRFYFVESGNISFRNNIDITVFVFQIIGLNVYTFFIFFFPSGNRISEFSNQDFLIIQVFHFLLLVLFGCQFNYIQRNTMYVKSQEKSLQSDKYFCMCGKQWKNKSFIRAAAPRFLGFDGITPGG
jgi:hypothetical protein